MQSKSKEQAKMADLKRWDTQTLIRCKNAWCGEVSFRYDFEKNGWKCPHCGKQISKDE
jgi:acetyl-CoA carboxylase beta subunit